MLTKSATDADRHPIEEFASHWWFCSAEMRCRREECFKDDVCCCKYKCSCIDAIQHFGYFVCKHVHLLVMLLNLKVPKIGGEPDNQGHESADDQVLGFSQSVNTYAPALQDEGVTIKKVTQLQLFKNKVCLISVLIDRKIRHRRWREPRVTGRTLMPSDRRLCLRSRESKKQSKKRSTSLKRVRSINAICLRREESRYRSDVNVLLSECFLIVF